MFLSAVWWLTVFSELAGSCLAASAAQSCMGLGKHGLTHWDPRSTGLANNCHHILLIAPALPELLWLPTVWRCPYIEIAFSTLDCSIVPTCGAWCSATAAKRGPLKQSWAEIQHSRDDEPLGVLMQMRNVRVNGFFFFSSLGVLPGQSPGRSNSMQSASRCVSRHSFVV